MMRAGLTLWCGLVLAGAALANDDLARGDVNWDRRAEGEREGRAVLEPIRASIRGYERALAAEPDRLEIRWKLLRSLHFAGDFTSSEPAVQNEFFDRARFVAEEGMNLVEERCGEGEALGELEPGEILRRIEAAGLPADGVARLYFWSSINWGAWSRNAGLVDAVRRGAANRLYRYARVTLALEPDYEGGGALRLLGRLHATLPRVPLLSGWVDRDRALPLLEQALTIAPAHPGNQLLLGLTLLDLAPERSVEADDQLRRVAELTPRPETRVEDWVLREEAREVLEAGAR